MAESEEELKSLLMKVKEESVKAGLKLSIQKTKIMASSSVTSWWVEGQKVDAVTDFLFLGSEITVDSDCSHEIKRHLLLERKATTDLDSVLKSRDITLLTKLWHTVKAMVFSVVFYRWESWTMEKAEHQRIDAFKLWCLKRLWCWEGLGAGGEGDNRGWDGWMALPTWWMWVWVNSGSW